MGSSTPSTPNDTRGWSTVSPSGASSAETADQVPQRPRLIEAGIGMVHAVPVGDGRAPVGSWSAHRALQMHHPRPGWVRAV